MARELTPLTAEQWAEVGRHHRGCFNALVRVGNVLRPMKAPIKLKGPVLRLQEAAWDLFHDIAIDLLYEAERQDHQGATGIRVGESGDGGEPHYHTDRVLVMGRHRWLDIGDVMLDCLDHARDMLALLAGSIEPVRVTFYGRAVRRVEKLRCALDDLVEAMEPEWNASREVFFRSRDDHRWRNYLGAPGPDDTLKAFFNPRPRTKDRSAYHQ